MLIVSRNLLLLPWLLAACNTSPQPFPMPLAPPDPKAIFVSNPEYGSKAAVTTGLPGAASASPAGTEVVLAVTPHTQLARGPVWGDGSFSVKLGTLLGGDQLEVWVEHEGEQSTHASVSWDRGSANSDGPFTVQVSAPPVVVSGQFTRGWQVVIGNLRAGAAAVATVDGSGGYSASIAGAAGDLLAVFGRDPATGMTTAVQEASVPAP